MLISRVTGSKWGEGFNKQITLTLFVVVKNFTLLPLDQNTWKGEVQKADYCEGRKCFRKVSLEKTLKLRAFSRN